MKKLLIFIGVLALVFLGYGLTFGFVKADHYAIEDMDKTTTEYQELQDRISEVEEKHSELYEDSNSFFWGDVYQYQHKKLIGKKETYCYIPYLYADTADVSTRNASEWKYYLGILSYQQGGEVMQTNIQNIAIEMKKGDDTGVLQPTIAEVNGTPEDTIRYILEDMKYQEEDNEYMLRLKVATRDSSIEQNDSVPLTLRITGMFEKSGGWVMQGKELFEIEAEMEDLK